MGWHIYDCGHNKVDLYSIIKWGFVDAKIYDMSPGTRTAIMDVSQCLEALITSLSQDAISPDSFEWRCHLNHKRSDDAICNHSYMLYRYKGMILPRWCVDPPPMFAMLAMPIVLIIHLLMNSFHLNALTNQLNAFIYQVCWSLTHMSQIQFKISPKCHTAEPPLYHLTEFGLVSINPLRVKTLS